MKTQFLQVNNVRRMVNALSQLRTRDAGVPGLALVQGPPGRGKTQSAIWYAANKGGRYLEANPAWSMRWMMNDFYLICKGLRKGPRIGTTQRAYEMTVDLLDTDPTPILIDEADRLCRNIQLLEMVRHLHDRTGVPIIMIGTDVLTGKLAQHDRFWRRVTQAVPFEALSIDELRMAAHELSGLELDAEAAAELERHTKGEFGSLIKSLPYLERAAGTNNTKSPAAELVNGVCGKALRRAA